VAASGAVRHRAGPTVTRRGEAEFDARGSASPVVIAMLAVIMTVSLAVVDAGSVLIARAATSSSADLAALAAAGIDRDLRAEGYSRVTALARGCDAAREVASRNGATVVACRRGDRSSVLVTVRTRTRAWPAPLVASARAGPTFG